VNADGTTVATAGPVRLSVVVIARNQERFVGPLIESILAETEPLGPAEIVLVDAASDDATAERASRFPIRVLRLDAGRRLTAAAGRYVGFHSTTGELILFVDGDMELRPGWLARAVEALAADEAVAGATGIVVDADPASVAAGRCADTTVERRPGIADLPWWKVGGIALYRRAAMDRCGTFDPSLYSDEEPELCLRLDHAGYRFVRLDMAAAYHFGAAPRTFASLRARRRRRLYLGYGQVVRLLLDTSRLRPYLRRRGYGLLPLIVLSLGLVALVWLLAAHVWLGVVVWAGLVAVAILADAIRKRSLYRAGYSVVNRLFIVEGMARGFVLPSIQSNTLLSSVEVASPSEPSAGRDGAPSRSER
jgi:glycosyltransferase involved in cell wall biosynthesis